MNNSALAPVERQKRKRTTAKRWLTPEGAIKALYDKIPDYCRWAVVTTCLLGLITHMFFLVNKLPNGDDLSELYHYNSMISSGRWLDILSKGLTSYYSIPWATGLVCLLLLSVCCALLCSLLGIYSKSGVMAAAAVLVTFPTMASYFSYMYYMDLYMLTMFFSIYAVWLVRKKAWGVYPGILFVCLALGNYQAYLGMTAVVSLLVLIRGCLTEELRMKEVLSLTAKLLLTGVFGLLLYLLVLRVLLHYFSVDLSAYQGISGMGAAVGMAGGAMGLTSLWRYTQAAYSGFLGYFYQDAFFTSPPMIKIGYSLLLLLSIFYLCAMVKQRLYAKPGRDETGKYILAFLFLGGLPIAYNLIYYMAPDAYVHSLMQPQYALFWLMPVMFSEWAFPKGKPVLPKRETVEDMPSGAGIIAQWLLFSTITAIVYFFFITVNISYLHLHLKYEITYATELRILDRIEALPDYQTDTPVCVIGAFPNENMSLYPYHTQDIVKGLVGINGNLVHHYYNYNGFYKNYLGRQLNLIRDDDIKKQQIAEWDEVIHMPEWPKSGAVSMIHGIVVVKIHQED